MKSSMISVVTILKALRMFEEHQLNEFTAHNDEQEYVLGMLPRLEEITYPKNSMKVMVSEDLGDLNKFLQENGFDIRLSGPIDLGIAAIMDLMGKWIEKAREARVSYLGNDYPAAHISVGTEQLTTSAEIEMLRILTDSGLRVSIIKDSAERSGLELFKYALEMSSLQKDAVSNECEAIIPLVSLVDMPDINFLSGMEATGENLFISEALQQNKLSISLDGIRAESATVLGLRKCVNFDKPATYIVDEPFTIWITHGESNFPLCVAFVAPADWKDPGKQ